MFMFGINLPVAEILFLLLLLFIAALVIIIIQLVKMSKHIKVLDETTLEIRRYEAEEDVTLKPLVAKVSAMMPSEKRAFTNEFIPAMSGLCRAAAAELVAGHSPDMVKATFMRHGIGEPTATRAVNNSIYALNRYSSISAERARDEARRIKSAAKKR